MQLFSLPYASVPPSSHSFGCPLHLKSPVLQYSLSCCMKFNQVVFVEKKRKKYEKSHHPWYNDKFRTITYTPMKKSPTLALSPHAKLRHAEDSLNVVLTYWASGCWRSLGYNSQWHWVSSRVSLCCYYCQLLSVTWPDYHPRRLCGKTKVALNVTTVKCSYQPSISTLAYNWAKCEIWWEAIQY